MYVNNEVYGTEPRMLFNLPRQTQHQRTPIDPVAQRDILGWMVADSDGVILRRCDSEEEADAIVAQMRKALGI